MFYGGKSIEGTPFPNSLSDLMLNDNKLKSIVQHNLFNLSVLEILNLAGNRIRILGPSVFLGNPNLTHILLDYNKLSHIPRDLFSKQTKLVELDLRNNHLGNIKQYDLPKIAKLKFYPQSKPSPLKDIALRALIDKYRDKTKKEQAEALKTFSEELLHNIINFDVSLGKIAHLVLLARKIQYSSGPTIIVFLETSPEMAHIAKRRVYLIGKDIENYVLNPLPITEIQYSSAALFDEEMALLDLLLGTEFKKQIDKEEHSK